MILIDAPIKPIPFKRTEGHGKRRYNAKRYSDFKEELGWYATLAMKKRRPIRGAIYLRLKVYKKLRGVLKACWGDVDNFLKATLDSLNGICYEDDAQVKKIEVEKFYGKPRLEIELTEMKLPAYEKI